MREKSKFWKFLIQENVSKQTSLKSFGILLLIFIFGIIPAFSGENSEKNPKSSTFNNQKNFVYHTNGNLWIAWDNLGNTGDISCSATVPAFSFPGGTVLYYLCRGGYWIVAKGNLVDVDGNPQTFLEGSTGEFVLSRGTFEGPVSQGWANPTSNYSKEPWVSTAEWSTAAGLKVVATRYSWSYPGKTNNYFKIGDPVEYFDFNDSILEDISITYDGDLNGDGIPDAQAVETIDQLVVAIKADHDCVWNTGPASFLENFWDDDGVDYDEETLTSFVLDGDRPTTAEDDTGIDDPLREYRGVHVGQSHISTPPVQLLIDGNFITFADKEPVVSHMWWTGENDPTSPARRFQFATAVFNALDEFTTDPEDFVLDPNLEGDLKNINPPVTDMRYMQAYGPWPISKGETIRIVTAAVAGSAGLEGGKNAARAAKQAFDWDFNLPKPPPAPKMFADSLKVTSDAKVRVYWENNLEDAVDPDLARADFAGYRIYRSSLSPVSNSEDILLAEGVQLPPNINESQPFSGNTGGPYQVIKEIPKSELNNFLIGTSGDTKQYEYIDGDVTQGFDYWYYVAAYDEGDPSITEWQGTLLPNGLPSLESYRTMNYPLNEVGTPSSPPRFSVPPPTSVQSPKADFPTEYVLGNNYPNPFNPSTIIPVAIPFRSEIKLKIYNILGEEVRIIYAGTIEPGHYLFKWDGTDDNGNILSGSVYLYRLTSNTNVTLIGKMIFLK